MRCKVNALSIYETSSRKTGKIGLFWFVLVSIGILGMYWLAKITDMVISTKVWQTGTPGRKENGFNTEQQIFNNQGGGQASSC